MPKAKKTDPVPQSTTTMSKEEDPTIQVETLSTKKVTKKVMDKPTPTTASSTTATSTSTSKKDTKTKETKDTKETKETNDTTTKELMDSTDLNEIEGASSISQFNEFMAKLHSVTTLLNGLKSDFRVLEKKYQKELKISQKAQAKKKRKSSNRQPSGFVKPTLISTELAVFLNKPEGTEMARTEVTREINGYIRSHNLQDKENGRKINPDQNLANLLKITNGEELTYFNLQRYMSPHFAKAGASSVTKEAN